MRKETIEFFNTTNKCLFAMELLGKYDVLVEIHVNDSEELRKIIDNFRNTFVYIYNDYDILTITKEYIMVWSPFLESMIVPEKRTMIKTD
ncbi:MAG: hypothetical protein ABIH34_04210 [Nanoarchaeota archaeon]